MGYSMARLTAMTMERRKEGKKDLLTEHSWEYQTAQKLAELDSGYPSVLTLAEWDAVSVKR